MNGIQPQHVFAQNDQFDIDPLSDQWLSNIPDVDTSLLDPTRPTLFGSHSCSHETTHYPTVHRGPRPHLDESSFYQSVPSHTVSEGFYNRRENLESLSNSNYSLECGLDGGSMSCPRTLPNVHLQRSFPKRLYNQEDAFPPSYYELNTSDPPDTQPLAGGPGPEAIQGVKGGFLESEEISAAGLPCESSLESLAHPQHSLRDFNPQGSVLLELDDGFIASREMTPDSEMKEEPYAKRIYRCLINAPGHTMVLREIYDWFIQHTDKGKEPDASAWKNSIRHNLSMNAAFLKVNQPQGEEQKKGCSWKLADFAVKEGVKSTTRYRTKAPSKRSTRTRDPDQKRMEAGAKGGQASKKAAQRRSQRLRDSSQLSSAGMHQLANSGPPPVYDVPLLGFDNRADRQASPYFLAQQSTAKYDQQPYAQRLPTNGVQRSHMLYLQRSPTSSARPDCYNHGSSFPQSKQPLHSPDGPFFYDSPADSGDEPITPSSLSIGRMPDPFWGPLSSVDHQDETEVGYGCMHSGFPT